MGEVGVWEDTRAHWSLFERQVALAAAHALPLVLTPPRHRPINMTNRAMARLEQLGVHPERVLLVGLEGERAEVALSEGFRVALAVGPYGQPPREVAALVLELVARAPDRAPAALMLTAGVRAGAADILGVPKTLRHLGELGADEALRRAVCHDNAARFYHGER